MNYAPNEFGGAERTVRTLAETLVQNGHKASVVSLAHDGRASQGQLNGVTTYFVPLANIVAPWAPRRPSAALRAAFHAIDVYNPVMGARVADVLEREKPDIVQTGNLKGFSVAVWYEAKRRGVPVVQMLHDYYLGCGNSAMFRSGRVCDRQCGRCRAVSLVRRQASHIPVEVIALSDRMLGKFRDCGFFCEPSRTTVIHGICASRPPTEVSPRKPGPLTVGFLGRIEPTKGLETLLEAARPVDRDLLRVLVAGSGDEAYVTGLKQRYDGPGMEFVGYSQPSTFFATIDVLAVPSIWEEPLGRVIYEAYAYGVPVIVSRAGGMPEIVDEGETGYVVPPSDPDALRALLLRLAATWDPERHADACVRKSKEFSAESRFGRFYEVWSRALESRRS
jgi:glycosyltransferase involved in cell wall biosynthesis